MTYRARVVPCLLLSGHGLVKTTKFRDPIYVGDPVNAARIFSEKEADEIFVLDIDASREGREPNYSLIADIASECFMPLAYGGGVKNLEQIKRLIRAGIEKVVINSAATENINLISEAAETFGSQAVVASVDVKKNIWGLKVVAKSGTVETKKIFPEYLKQLEVAGAGEILLNSVDRDGTMLGYDLALIRSAVDRVNVPVVAIGGAGNTDHMNQALEAGASAVSAGSMFVFHGKHKAVLISYLSDNQRSLLTTVWKK